MNLFIQDKTEPFSMPYLNFTYSVKTGETSTPSKHRSMEQLLKSPQVQEIFRDQLKLGQKKNGSPKHSTQFRYHIDSTESPIQNQQQLLPKIEKHQANMHMLSQIKNMKRKKVNTSPKNIKKSSHYKKYQYQQGKFMQLLQQPLETVNTLNISSKPIHVIQRERSRNFYQDQFLNSSMDNNIQDTIVDKIRRQIQKQTVMEQQEDIIRPIKPAIRQSSQQIKTSRNTKIEPLTLKEKSEKSENLEKREKKEKKKIRKFDGIYFIDPKYPQDLMFQQKYASMRNYFNIINLSNYLFVQPTINIYKAYIGKGNNGMLVRQILKTRWWWTILDEQDQCHFVWTQLKVNAIHEQMKQLIRNQQDLCSPQSASSSLTTMGSASFGFMQKEDQSDNEQNEVCKKKQSQWSKLISQQDIRQFNQIFNSFGRSSKLLNLEQAQNIRPTITCISNDLPKIHNHLENNFHLGNKKALFYNMRAYYESQNQNVFDSLPLTFHIKSNDGIEYKQFIEAFQNRQALMQQIDQEQDGKNKKIKNIWIIKPGEITNRGNGIKVSEDINEIQSILNSKEMHKNGSYKTYIVQLYIDRPLLYNKRKFDIRCFSLYTSVNGFQKGYWYNEGYIRTSSKEFSIKNLTNKMVHLTNDAVQKKSDDYGKFEKGNKVSFEEFSGYVENLGGDFSKIYNRMKDMATEQFKSVYGKMDPNRRENTFEIFGLDFMIDDSFNVFMIEVNTNPCLEISCPLLSKLIPSMLESAFKVVLDPLYPPPNFYNPKKIPYDNYLDNKFELIFDELVDAANLNMISSTNTYDIGLIEEESEDEELE